MPWRRQMGHTTWPEAWRNCSFDWAYCETPITTHRVISSPGTASAHHKIFRLRHIIAMRVFVGKYGLLGPKMPWSKMSNCVPGVVFYTLEPCMRGNKDICWTIVAFYAGWSSCHPSREGWWKSNRMLIPPEGNSAVDFGGLKSHGRLFESSHHSVLPWLPWQHWPPCLQVFTKDL